MNGSKGIMDGKVVLISGGTGGIGKATAEGLANLGARVVVVGRDQSKGESATAEIQAKSGNEAVELMVADLSSQAEIHRLAREVGGHPGPVGPARNNAGAFGGGAPGDADGIEGTLAVIHLAPVLLTSL